MSNRSNLDIVKDLYAAFGTGNMQALLAGLDESVTWSVPGSAPWCGEGRGHAHVMTFFEAFGRNAQLQTFEPRSFVADGEQVVVLGYEEGKSQSTGRGWKAHFAHTFTVSDGKITAHRELIDTQAIASAY